MQLGTSINGFNLGAPEQFSGANTSKYTTIEGHTFWFSYRTCIAFKPSGGDLIISQNEWGTTTGKHLNAINRDKGIRADRETFEGLLKGFKV